MTSHLAILTFPTAAEALMPDQIVERLRSEFEQVLVDPHAGRAHCSKELSILRMINAPREVVEMTERGVATAQWVTVREGELKFEFMLIPEGNIRIDHDERLHTLIQRCARVLNCVVDECG